MQTNSALSLAYLSSVLFLNSYTALDPVPKNGAARVIQANQENLVQIIPH